MSPGGFIKLVSDGDARWLTLVWANLDEMGRKMSETNNQRILIICIVVNYGITNTYLLFLLVDCISKTSVWL